MSIRNNYHVHDLPRNAHWLPAQLKVLRNALYRFFRHFILIAFIVRKGWTLLLLFVCFQLWLFLDHSRPDQDMKQEKHTHKTHLTLVYIHVSIKLNKIWLLQYFQLPRNYYHFLPAANSPFCSEQQHFKKPKLESRLEIAAPQASSSKFTRISMHVLVQCCQWLHLCNFYGEDKFWKGWLKTASCPFPTAVSLKQQKGEGGESLPEQHCRGTFWSLKALLP